MRHFSILSVSIIALALTACGDDDTNTSSVDSSASNTTPPSFSAGQDQVVQEQVEVQLTGSASDPDGDNLTIS